MNQSTIHAADCRCSKCPGARFDRHRRLLAIMALYALGIALAVVALLMGAAAQ